MATPSIWDKDFKTKHIFTMSERELLSAIKKSCKDFTDVSQVARQVILLIKGMANHYSIQMNVPYLDMLKAMIYSQNYSTPNYYQHQFNPRYAKITDPTYRKNKRVVMEKMLLEYYLASSGAANEI
jgi:hypothetical protein